MKNLFEDSNCENEYLSNNDLAQFLHLWIDAILINKRAAPAMAVGSVRSKNTFRVSSTETIGVPL